MYSKHESALLKQEFWTNFGRYMSPILSAEGEKINWINYKTGEKYINFKMQADSKAATIFIEISNPDLKVQEVYFQQFLSLKKMFKSSMNEEWNWLLHATDDTNRVLSKISKELAPANIFNKQDWPALISFFKQRIISLDKFWSTARYSFETLR